MPPGAHPWRARCVNRLGTSSTAGKALQSPKTIVAAGVALDDLVYLCTKIARQMDTQGVDRVFEAMESARAAIEDAKPLLSQAVKLSDEVGGWHVCFWHVCFWHVVPAPPCHWPCCHAMQILPLLTELRAGNLVGNVEALTQVCSMLRSIPSYCWTAWKRASVAGLDGLPSTLDVAAGGSGGRGRHSAAADRGAHGE